MVRRAPRMRDGMSENRIDEAIKQHNIELRKENSELRIRQALIVKRAEQAEALLREVIEMFQLRSYPLDEAERILPINEWGDLTPEAAAVIKKVRLHLGGSDIE